MSQVILAQGARIAEKHKQILADLNNGLSHAEIYRKYRIGNVWLKKLIQRFQITLVTKYFIFNYKIVV